MLLGERSCRPARCHLVLRSLKQLGPRELPATAGLSDAALLQTGPVAEMEQGTL